MSKEAKELENIFLRMNERMKERHDERMILQSEIRDALNRIARALEENLGPQE